MSSYSDSYKEAGVDIQKGYKAVELMKEHVGRTMSFGDTEDIGGFGGLFGIGQMHIDDPVLVSGTDGVGTKLKLAFLTGRHDTVGIDCVAMCVNDILCVGAKPLFFLDYIACGKNDPEKIAEIVKGVSEGCVQSRIALIGGETAEMPGFYPEDEYDLAGFAVGIVPRKHILDKTTVREGDIVIALPSSGIHSNGYSLVRKVLDVENRDLHERPFGPDGGTLADILLAPTKIYTRAIMALIKNVKVKSIANITGGGFYENIPRSLPAGMSCVIKRDYVRVLPVFDLIREEGGISEHDMFNTFNMGVGMTVICARDEADKAIDVLQKAGVDAYIIGETREVSYDEEQVKII